MTKYEMEQIAQEVANYLRNDGGRIEPAREVMPTMGGCAIATPSINEKAIEDVVSQCRSTILDCLNTDEEQFFAVGRLREMMVRHWDEQLSGSTQVSKFNAERANTLGKFIDMTIPR